MIDKRLVVGAIKFVLMKINESTKNDEKKWFSNGCAVAAVAVVQSHTTLAKR